MTRRVGLALAVLGVGAVPVAAVAAGHHGDGSRPTVVQVRAADPVATARALDHEGFAAVAAGRAVDVAADDGERARLVAGGYAPRPVAGDPDRLQQRARALTARAAPGGLPSGRTSYRTLDDYNAEMKALAAAHPDSVKLFALSPATVEGRQILGVQIAKDVGKRDGRPAFVVLGLIHAREWPSGEVAMEYAHDLAEHASDPRIAKLLAGERTVIVPVVNPDGLVATQQGGQPTRRRNCEADAGDGPSASCVARHGVDLNRNFGAWWGGPGASTSPSQDTYRGPAPFSEPETKAIHALLAGLPTTGVIVLHNIDGLVLRQPGFAALGATPDDSRMAALGDAMGAATGYTSEPAASLYDATGAAEDWSYASQGAFGYTIELGPASSTQFQGPFQTHVVDQYLGSAAAGTTGRGMRDALMLAGEEADDTSDHARIRGTAPRGAVLTLSKTFTTPTSPVCADDSCATTGPRQMLADATKTRLRVDATGRWAWVVGPSTRPFVARAGGREAYTLSCSLHHRVVASHKIFVKRGQRAVLAPCSRAAKVKVGGDA